MENVADIMAVALDTLGMAADEHGTSLHIHHCPRGDWCVWFGEAECVHLWLAQEPTHAEALIVAAENSARYKNRKRAPEPKPERPFATTVSPYENVSSFGSLTFS